MNVRPTPERLGPFVALAAFGMRRPRSVLAIAALVCGLSVMSGLRMKFRSELTDLAPDEVREAIQDLEREFGVSDHLVLLVSTETQGVEECLIEFARRLRRTLETDERIGSVTYGWGDDEDRLLRGDLLSCAPLFAREEDLEDLGNLFTGEGIRRSLEKQRGHRSSDYVRSPQNHRVRAFDCDATSYQHLLHTVRCRRFETRRIAGGHLTYIERVKAIDILGGIDSSQDFRTIDMTRERELNQYSMNTNIDVEPVDC